MKTKGIPFWEQHLERIVLAIAVLIFAGFVAMQFIGDPGAVEKGGETFSAGNVDRRLEETAEPLDTRLSRTAPSPIEISDPVSTFGLFQRRLSE